MKTKKYLIAIAIFGGMLFTVHASNLIDLDKNGPVQIDKKKGQIPSNG